MYDVAHLLCFLKDFLYIVCELHLIKMYNISNEILNLILDGALMLVNICFF